tara:strand:- start:115 stop:288 length:174 start_codon:yes stop_codon:yes gene_type:complete
VQDTNTLIDAEKAWVVLREAHEQLIKTTNQRIKEIQLQVNELNKEELRLLELLKKNS